MIYDCHLHTEFSGDSDTPVQAQIKRAAALGMKEIAVTDHHDYDCPFCEDDFELHLPEYLSALKSIKKKYEDSADKHWH